MTEFLDGLLITVMIAVGFFTIVYSVRAMIYAYDWHKPEWVQHLGALFYLWMIILVVYIGIWLLGGVE